VFFTFKIFKVMKFTPKTKFKHLLSYSTFNGLV
jgi:hypothetical protein